MNHSSRVTATVAVLLVINAAARAAEPESKSWTINGIERRALVYAPSKGDHSKPAPLVFVFHGHGGSPQNIDRTMHIQTVWPAAYVVYMQGIPTPTRVDVEGKKPGWQCAPGQVDDRDLKFFDTVLADLRKNHPIDESRIYATGFSNGGVFTYVLWSERPNVFAALAPCAGLPLPGVHVKVPKPVFIVAGEADPLVKIENQRAMIEEVRKLDSATSTGKQVDLATLYHSDQGTPVETLVHSAGHVLPKEAPKLIVDFFRAHELKK
jgi:polyhydroxybutyrate depolymerase